MKKWLFLSGGILVGGALVWAGVWAWDNLRGIGPVVKNPPVNISDVINTNENPLKAKGGFRLSIFADGFEKPRDLFSLGDELFVSDTEAGEVYLLRDADSNGKIEGDGERLRLLEGLNHPHGILVQCDIGGIGLPDKPSEAGADDTCYLFVAEEDALMRYTLQNAVAMHPQKIIDLPSGGRHTTRSLVWNPGVENELLVSIGSTCNVCEEGDALRGSIQAVNTVTGEVQPFATGLRNSVFMTEVMGGAWATEMGRDELGDDLPPDEVNIVTEGEFYGWPYCYGHQVQDTAFDGSQAAAEKCTASHSPYIELPAHVAPLGIAFVPKDIGWPDYVEGDILIALHGSWNRSEPVGYKIIRYNYNAVDGTTPSAQEDFITGWLTADDEAIGRPVDLEFDLDGTLYISDDKAGVVYRLTYGEEAPPYGTCRPTGCSGQLCADSEISSTCEYTAAYGCYSNATCERQESGECGWTLTPDLIQCLNDAGAVVETE